MLIPFYFKVINLLRKYFEINGFEDIITGNVDLFSLFGNDFILLLFNNDKKYM